MRVVNRYVGVEGGHLGNFTYRTLRDFYPEYCDLNVEIDAYEGTMRERFIAILEDLPPREQARVLRGAIERFPLDGAEAPDTRTSLLADELAALARRLEGIEVDGVNPATRRVDVTQAIADTEILLKSAGGAPVSVDRVHTALHAYLMSLCDDQSIPYEDRPTMAKLVKLLRSAHPSLRSSDTASRAQDVLQSLAQAFDALNPIRNSASMAHPNDGLLDEPEAQLIVNAGRTIMAYLNARLA